MCHALIVLFWKFNTVFSGTVRSALLLFKVFVELSHSTGFECLASVSPDKCNRYNGAKIENYNCSA